MTRYIAEIATRCQLTRPLRGIAACGNGTAGAFAVETLKRMGAEVIPMDCDLDWSFPKYNPNPEDHEMLHAMVPDEYDTSGRRVVHHKKFLERERRFHWFRRAKNWEQENLARFLQ